MDLLVCFKNGFSCPVFDGHWMDCIGVIIIEDKNVSIASAGGDWKFSCLVRESLAGSFKGFKNGCITGMGFDSFVQWLGKENFC